MDMKKLFLICTTVGFMAACNSNKKSSSAQIQSPQTNAAVSTNNSSKASGVDEKTANGTPVGKSHHLDSLMTQSGGSSERYNHREGNFKGATGAGTGGSYAGAGYAQSRYKRKAKPKVKRVFDAPYEQEPVVTQTINPDTLNNGNMPTTLGDSVNVNNGLTGLQNPMDSTSTSKGDSTNINTGW
jgi:hypothetical protein